MQTECRRVVGLCRGPLEIRRPGWNFVLDSRVGGASCRDLLHLSRERKT